MRINAQLASVSGERGKHKFIAALHEQHQMKVFGSPLAELVKYDGNKHPQLDGVPHFVYQAIRSLVLNGMGEEGIFRISAGQESVNQMKARLDNGEEIDFVAERKAAYDVAAMLKLYLRQLPEPLLISSNYDRWLLAHGQYSRDLTYIITHSDDSIAIIDLPLEMYDAEKLKEIRSLIQTLPPANLSLLKALITFLYRVSINSKINKMDHVNLATTVGPNLLWRSDGKMDLSDAQNINDIVSFMIQNAEDIFPECFRADISWVTWFQKLQYFKKSVQHMIPGYQQKEIWTTDTAGNISVIDSQTYQLNQTFSSGQAILLCMSDVNNANSPTVWTGSPSNIKVWNQESKELVTEINYPCFCLTEVDEEVWVGEDHKIRILDPRQYVQLAEIQMKGMVRDMCLDYTNEQIWCITSNRELELTVCSTKTREVIKKIQVEGGKPVNTLTRYKREVWAGGVDGVSIYNQKFEMIRKLSGHEGTVNFVVNFGDYVWTCGSDCTLCIWNDQSTQPLHRISDYHGDKVSSVTFVHDEERHCWKAWTGGFDKSVCVFGISINYDSEEEEPEEDESSKTLTWRSHNMSPSPPVSTTLRRRDGADKPPPPLPRKALVRTAMSYDLGGSDASLSTIRANSKSRENLAEDSRENYENSQEKFDENSVENSEPISIKKFQSTSDLSKNSPVSNSPPGEAPAWLKRQLELDQSIGPNRNSGSPITGSPRVGAKNRWRRSKRMATANEEARRQRLGRHHGKHETSE
ncbi:RhoGAP domain-containing protein [Planoprotostelium fungivorum]|uniref:RhoGAP domain-containing protein n=1 Tax=Planoprotostelium fungivorum TaxID=1890364 RepID=A0A2P6NZC2_9EUKA|nr:RhoGAP domain-containing protein [Planoprotostelium fungivorum]